MQTSTNEIFTQDEITIFENQISDLKQENIVLEDRIVQLERKTTWAEHESLEYVKSSDPEVLGRLAEYIEWKMTKMSNK